MTKREADAQITREKIINAADSLIHEKGYENTSVEDITQASSVAKGTFYNYFKKKEDITLALSKKHLSKLNRIIPTLDDKNPEDAIRCYLTTYIDLIVSPGDKWARQWIRYIVNPKNHEKWEYDLDSLKKILNNMVKNKQLVSETPVDTIAKLLLTQIYGIVLSWCISPKTVDPIRDINLFCNLQLKAILAKYLI